MKNQTHTPGKLVAIGPELYGEGISGKYVADCSASLETSRDEDEANAARLALCWNSHDALLAALENCVETLEYAKRAANGGAEWIAVIEARAALAKAKGE